jgi:hypothetical protein
MHFSLYLSIQGAEQEPQLILHEQTLNEFVAMSGLGRASSAIPAVARGPAQSTAIYHNASVIFVG